MKKFALVLLAVCMTAGAASAMDTMKKPMHPMMHKPMMHHHMMMHHWAACGEGMVKASCVCKGATAHAMCKAGQWCHSWAGACTM
jgi:hypothetical protein